MNVLLISREYPPYEKGGICRIAVYLAKYADRYGVNLTIIANHPLLGIATEKVNSTIIYRVPSLGKTFLTQMPSFGYYASRMVDKIQDDYDVLYSIYSPLFCRIKRPFIGGFFSTRYGEYVTCRKTGKPFHALLNRGFVPMEKRLIQKADGLTVNSEKLMQEIWTMGGRKKPIEHIPSGVDTEIFRPLQSRQFNRREKRILCVARLDVRKGLDFLFHAFKKVARNVKSRLIIGGGGMERAHLVKLAKSLSIPVQFLGTIPYERLVGLYNEADLFVLPSLYEGMPLVALEAMACGTPTIVSDASPNIGIPRFKRGDVESLERMLIETLTDEEKLSALSERSIEISKHYSWKRIVDHTYRILRSFT